MGAVGNCIKGGGFFTDETTTNGDNFRSFITALKRDHIKEEFKGSKPYILLDNHPCHKSKASQLIVEQGFRILW